MEIVLLNGIGVYLYVKDYLKYVRINNKKLLDKLNW